MAKTRIGLLLIAENQDPLQFWNPGRAEIPYVKSVFVIGKEYFSNLERNRLDEAFDL